MTYTDGSQSVLPVRARFEVGMVESNGRPWAAVAFSMPESCDPATPPDNEFWGWRQLGIEPVTRWCEPGPLLCAMENPHAGKGLRSLTIRGLRKSPLLIAGVTLYQGSDNPLRHLPRRMYRVNLPGKAAKIEKAELDLGTVTRIEHTSGPRGKRWLEAPSPGIPVTDPRETTPDRDGEDIIEMAGARDATLSVELAGRKKPLAFFAGEAFHEGRNSSGRAHLQVLGRERQWVLVTVTDGSTGKPTPVRIQLSGSRGEYIAPYGHHAQINPNWFEDYGADAIVSGQNHAYVPGRFTTDLPVGDIYVQMWKGFEYQPVRTRIRLRPGQKKINLKINRWKDLRSEGWVTADTHVHFISPHTAWLEGQAEGVNVVNLLASQWGRLFTNVGDIIGKPNVVEDDTIVYVGTENRNHMLGHMSMLSTADLPVYPMCRGGVTEAWIGDPDFRMLAEWALENKRKRGVVIRPHYPPPAALCMSVP